jgi:hypothetical protein
VTSGAVLVASQGFEPQYAESESAVLPLNDEAIRQTSQKHGSGQRGERDLRIHSNNHTRLNVDGSIQRLSPPWRSATYFAAYLVGRPDATLAEPPRLTREHSRRGLSTPTNFSSPAH